ncbi:MAG: hypothetical protein D6718_00500 [Acidobacteria bacterium]|nr:MAG: hypothetical protein D6718_00500 [Acidobacteriota bacterium]
MDRRFPCALAPILLLSAVAAAPAGAGTGEPGICRPDRPIRRIVIERVPVFDLEDDGGHLRGLYRAANLLHRPMQTRAATIRSLLTIREGEPCSREALEEAERVLRSYIFVQDAWVTPAGIEDGGVVVRVRVQDAWSTRVRLSARRQGGASKTAFGLREVNLFGTGSQLQWTSSRDQDRSETVFTFLDPALGPTKWRLLARYGDNSDGLTRELSVGRPFYELDGRWEFLIDADSAAREEKVYVGGEIADRWRVRRNRARVSFGWSPRGLEGSRLRRWYLRAGVREESWTPAAGAAPARPDLAPLDRDQLWLGAGREWFDIDFRRVSLIDTGRRVEDLDLSRRVAIGIEFGAGRGEAAGGGTLILEARDGFQTGRDAYLLLGARHRVERLGSRFVDAETELRARYVQKPSPLTALNLDLQAFRGSALEGPRRRLMGGDTGLRGYPSRAFSGDRALLLRAEFRYFAPWSVGKLFRLGAVAFAELGGAWDRGHRLGAEVLHPDVGIGLRAYVKPSSGGTTLHLNAAYPLHREVAGRHFGLQVSFLAARSF